MICPFCGDVVFPLVTLFDVTRQSALKPFCAACADTLKRAAMRRATYSHLTFTECLDKYVEAVKAAFDEESDAGQLAQ